MKNKIAIISIANLLFILLGCKKEEAPVITPSCYSDAMIASFNDTTKNYFIVEKLPYKIKETKMTIVDILINDRSIGVPVNNTYVLNIFTNNAGFFDKEIHVHNKTDILEIKYEMEFATTLGSFYIDAPFYDSSFYETTGGEYFYKYKFYDVTGISNSKISFNLRMLGGSPSNSTGIYKTVEKQISSFTCSGNTNYTQYFALKMDFREPVNDGYANQLLFPAFKIINSYEGCCVTYVK